MGRFWLILFLIAVFLSLGSNIPGMSAWLNAIPGVNLLRVPPRWMFLAGLALAMLAARGLTALESATKALDIHWKAGFALAAAGIVLAVASSAMDLPSALWQDGLILFALGGIFFLGFSSRHLASRAILALMCLAVFDLALADSRLIDARPADLSTADERAAAAFLQSEGSEYRVYSPSYSVSQWTAVRYGLRTLDGVNPLILKSTAETVSAADGVPLAGYSVTLPPFAAGRPAVDNRDAVPDGALLGLLNVRYIVSAFEIPGAMPGVRRQFGSIYVYENPSAMPRAWVAEGPDTWSRPVAGHWARVDYDSPNRMRLTALGPGLLVIAEASYPAWRATVDGKAAELLTVGGWWRAVEIGPGEHSVELDYDASLSRLGFAITALALAAYLGVRRWAK